MHLKVWLTYIVDKPETGEIIMQHWAKELTHMSDRMAFNPETGLCKQLFSVPDMKTLKAKLSNEYRHGDVVNNPVIMANPEMAGTFQPASLEAHIGTLAGDNSMSEDLTSFCHLGQGLMQANINNATTSLELAELSNTVQVLADSYNKLISAHNKLVDRVENKEEEDIFPRPKITPKLH